MELFRDAFYAKLCLLFEIRDRRVRKHQLVLVQRLVSCECALDLFLFKYHRIGKSVEQPQYIDGTRFIFLKKYSIIKAKSIESVVTLYPDLSRAGAYFTPGSFSLESTLTLA